MKQELQKKLHGVIWEKVTRCLIMPSETLKIDKRALSVQFPCS